MKSVVVRTARKADANLAKSNDSVKGTSGIIWEDIWDRVEQSFSYRIVTGIRFARMCCIAPWLDCVGPRAPSCMHMHSDAIHRLGN